MKRVCFLFHHVSEAPLHFVFSYKKVGEEYADSNCLHSSGHHLPSLSISSALLFSPGKNLYFKTCSNLIMLCQSVLSNKYARSKESVKLWSNISIVPVNFCCFDMYNHKRNIRLIAHLFVIKTVLQFPRLLQSHVCNMTEIMLNCQWFRKIID